LQPFQIAIYMVEFASVKTECFSREETGKVLAYVRKQTIYGTTWIPPYPYVHNNNLLHCNPFIFNI